VEIRRADPPYRIDWYGICAALEGTPGRLV
jgi:hypothetical protein